MDLRRLIATFRTWLPLMVAAAVVCGVAAFAISNLQQRVYESKATLIVGQALSATNPDYSQILVAESLSKTYAAIAKTRPILEAVIAQLRLKETTDQLAERVRVESPTSSTMLMITALDGDPAQAARLANALGDQLISVSPTIQGREAEFQNSIDADLAETQGLINSTQARVETLAALDVRTAQQEAQLAALEGRLASLRSTYSTLLSFSSGAASNLLTVVEPGGVAISPVAPRVLLNTLLAVVLGLLIVAAIAFVAEQLDDSIRTAEVVEEVTGRSTLGTIPRMRGDRGRSEIYRLAAILYPRSSVAEAYRTLRSNIEFASVDKPLSTLLVTSAVPNEGKTVTAANLAVVFAQAGRRVLLVDADLRQPSVHQIFNVANAHGLTTMLRNDRVSPDEVSHVSEQANLRILATGPLPPNPAELLGSHRMQAVLALLQQSADLVIFDSPPLQAVTDSAILSSFVDGTLFVVDARRSRRRTVRLATEALARAGANVVGAVLNRIPAEADPGYAMYYGGSGSPKMTEVQAAASSAPDLS